MSAAAAEYQKLHCGRGPLKWRGQMLPTAASEIQSAIQACGHAKPSFERHSVVRNKTGLVRMVRKARPEPSPAPHRASRQGRRQGCPGVPTCRRRHVRVIERDWPEALGLAVLAAQGEEHHTFHLDALARLDGEAEPQPLRPLGVAERQRVPPRRPARASSCAQAAKRSSGSAGLRSHRRCARPPRPRPHPSRSRPSHLLTKPRRAAFRKAAEPNRSRKIRA